MEHLNALIAQYGYAALAVGCLLEGETVLLPGPVNAIFRRANLLKKASI